MNGVLLPKTYIERTKYLTEWPYRSTWYAIIVGFTINLLMLMQWQQLSNTEQERASSSKVAKQAEDQYSKKKAETSALIEKYNDLQNWAGLRRIPITPAMEAVEVCVTSDIGLSRFNWELKDLRKGYKEGIFSIDIFSRSPNVTLQSVFVVGLMKTLSKNDLKCGNPAITQGVPKDDGYIYTLTIPITIGEK